MEVVSVCGSILFERQVKERIREVAELIKQVVLLPLGETESLLNPSFRLRENGKYYFSSYMRLVRTPFYGPLTSENGKYYFYSYMLMLFLNQSRKVLSSTSISFFLSIIPFP
jgi:hypothetical protein